MKYLKIILFLFVISLFSFCKKDNKNCQNFKYGKFTQNLEELKIIVYSERTKDGYQLDSSKFGVSKYKLTWKSECDLESKLVETNIPISKKYIGRTYYVSVLKSLSKSSYIYKCQVKGIDFVDIDTIVKIN